MTATFDNLSAGDVIDGPKFAVSRESIRLFCDASLDYNPLHLDDDFMKGNFGKTNFGGIIMHGMNNFGLISRMLTDWPAPPARCTGGWRRGGSSRSGPAIPSSPRGLSRPSSRLKNPAGC